MLSLIVFLPLVAGHGLMNWPPSRAVNDMITGGWCSGLDPSQVPQNGTCLWFNQGCTTGCPKCTGANCIDASCCDAPMKPTNNDMKYRTYQNIQRVYDFTKNNPWRAPGYAPIESPCGLAGGWYTQGEPGNGGYPPTGIKQGFDGLKMPASPITKWKAGSEEMVSWSLHANHGGGYSYRLCPKSSEATEKCFKAGHLEFVGDNSWIQYGNNVSNRTAIPAVRLDVGTHPEGSQWTRNPIPACSGPGGGSKHEDKVCNTPQFEPPLPGLYGFGVGRCNSGLPGQQCSQEEYDYWTEKFNFNIIDMVKVPANLPKGDYLLSFRWDCEQTPQIWADCSDIKIV